MQVVEDNVKISCRCHGLSGSCATKTCWRELPTLYEIGDILRTKYDNAVKVDVHHPRHGGPATLRYYDSDSDVHRKPPNTELVYLEKSGNYCILIQNYTQGRYCMPSTNLTTTSRLGEYYPSCEDFCCTKQFYTVQRQEIRSCNCRFVWCCEVVCQTCTETITEYRCTGWGQWARNSPISPVYIYIYYIYIHLLPELLVQSFSTLSILSAFLLSFQVYIKCISPSCCCSRHKNAIICIRVCFKDDSCTNKLRCSYYSYLRTLVSIVYKLVTKQ